MQTSPSRSDRHKKSQRPRLSQPGSRAGSLKEEITILRSVLQHLNDIYTQGTEYPPEILKISDAIGKTATRLALLARTQNQLTGSDSDQIQLLATQALSETVDELGIQ